MSGKSKEDYSYRTTFIVNGKRYDIKAKTAKELKEKEILKRIEIEKNENIIDSSTSVKKWAVEWLETYKKNKISNENYKNYEQNLKNHIYPIIGSMKLKDVRQMHLQKILNGHAGESKSHVSHIKNALTGMFRQAKINRLLLNDPSEGLTLPQVTQGSHRSITEAERTAILEVAKTHYAKWLIYFSLYCGLRPSETAALQWKDIDLEKKIVHVSKAVDRQRKIKSPKTKAGNRDVPIPEEILEELKEEAKSKSDKDYILKTSTGTILYADTISKWWANVIRHVDIYMGAIVERNKITKSIVANDLTLYCLRHTYCTDLQRAEVPLNIAKYLMGHDDIQVTAKIYTHYTDDQGETTREKINAHLESAKNPKKNDKNVEKSVETQIT